MSVISRFRRPAPLEAGDAAHHTNRARKLIGFALLALLILIVLLGFAVLFLLEQHWQDVGREALLRSKDDATALRFIDDEAKADADRLAQLLNIVFGPVVTLLGSVTGFYFGSARGERHGARRDD